MQTRDFDSWLATFRESIATYSYYTDFGKVIANANAIRRQLCLMNSLLGSGDKFEAEFESLAHDYPEILQCIPILLASRNKLIPVQTTEAFLVFDFKHPNLDLHHYTEFMRNTGLADLIGRRLVASLVDYVFGVEAGLDSNARKNRGGHLMEDLVETFLKEANLLRRTSTPLLARSSMRRQGVIKRLLWNRGPFRTFGLSGLRMGRGGGVHAIICVKPLMFCLTSIASMIWNRGWRIGFFNDAYALVYLCEPRFHPGPRGLRGDVAGI